MTNLATGYLHDSGAVTTPIITVNTDDHTTGEPFYANEQLEYVYFALHLLIFLVSLVGNSLALVALLTTTSNLYSWFFNLVTADLLKTLICMPYSLYVLWEYDIYRTNTKVTPPFCGVEGAIFLTCLLVSLISNAAISIDRVVAITRPIFYANSQRKLNPLVPILMTWICVSSLCFVPLYLGPYTYSTYIPTCLLEVHNLLHNLPYSISTWLFKLVTGTVYAVLFGVPILVVCVSCGIVSYKLFRKSAVPNMKHEAHKVEQGARSSESMRSNVTNVTKMSRISVDDTTVHGDGARPSLFRPAEELLSKWSDKMELLHSSNTGPAQKSSNSILRRQRLQRKAALTMTMVAVTFFLCHVPLFTMWALWDVVKSLYVCSLPDRRQPLPDHWNYGFCVGFHTLHITLVYLNAPLNVGIYYYRCSYLRQRMGGFVAGAARACAVPWVFVCSKLLH